jgi:hypothetical protein
MGRYSNQKLTNFECKIRASADAAGHKGIHQRLVFITSSKVTSDKNDKACWESSNRDKVFDACFLENQPD